VEPPLACSVRNCNLPLIRRDRAFVCSRGHAYDVARSGYLNLLQPQDRRSRHAGDAKTAIEARARLLAAGVGRTILDAFVERTAALDLGSRPVVADLGAGSGDALGTLAASRSILGIGVDLSTAAAEHAARRFPALTWVVANADRRLPVLDQRLDLVISLHGRRNPAECARVLKRSGFLFVAVPAPDDLIQLREVVLGRGVERDRSDAVVAEHSSGFTLVDRASVREQHRLERERLLDLLGATYRGKRTSTATRVDALERLDVTLASQAFVFSRR
jgi:23S rRNA (guanine745-N1)-methyltransferase